MRALMLVLTLGLVSTASAQPGSADDPGRAMYLRYCGACHGPEARGDGIAGTFMTPKPPDLTLIAAQNGGKFPLQQVKDDIDGTDTIRAHGDPTMPVWGEMFRAETGWSQTRRAEVESKIMAITQYVKSIQRDEPKP